MGKTEKAAEPAGAGAEDAAYHMIRDALRQLKFGTVTVVVQDGVVVQVERTEKRRIPRKRSFVD